MPDPFLLVVIVEKADEEPPGFAMRTQQLALLLLALLEYLADGADVLEPLRDARQPEEQRKVQRGVDAVKVATFALSGMAAGLAGTIDASRVLSAQATSGGTFLTFTVLTGIIVGGTSILGGEGAVQRTVIGCLFVALVANGFNLLGLDPFYQQVTLGVILLLAVGLDAWSRRAD